MIGENSTEFSLESELELTSNIPSNLAQSTQLRYLFEGFDLETSRFIPSALVAFCNASYCPDVYAHPGEVSADRLALDSALEEVALDMLAVIRDFLGSVIYDVQNIKPLMELSFIKGIAFL
jgi:hypothetical protein